MCRNGRNIIFPVYRHFWKVSRNGIKRFLLFLDTFCRFFLFLGTFSLILDKKVSRNVRKWIFIFSHFFWWLPLWLALINVVWVQILQPVIGGYKNPCHFGNCPNSKSPPPHTHFWWIEAISLKQLFQLCWIKSQWIFWRWQKIIFDWYFDGNNDKCC